ncbi:hypothetical protein [Aquipuribacter nitratireducens]|uniref:CHRD domain-containing protein n=1 Tax=Aquipuribacter nitratireducens TaxID=650104 RepID=A0ABW0GRH1_9MICO
MSSPSPALALATALGATAALALAAPAVAGHDGNPSDRVAAYAYDLDQVQSGVPGTDATGSTRITALPNGKLQVKVEASGLAPGLPHAVHLHDTTGTDRDPSQCPVDADTDGNGVVTVVEGGPFYGGIIASLTTTGDTSAASGLALDRFPVAEADGTLSYSRTFTPADPAAFAQAGSVQVVVHGADFDGSGGYAFNPDDYFAAMPSSLVASVPLEATVPVLCGGILN